MTIITIDGNYYNVRAGTAITFGNNLIHFIDIDDNRIVLVITDIDYIA